MKFSLRTLLVIIAIAGVACLIGTWAMRSQANDFWGYGNYGIGDGTTSSPVFYIEVRGVGSAPTFARVVRFPDHRSAPSNALAFGQNVSDEIRTHIQNADRWNGTMTLIAGRSLKEKVSITLDHRTAKLLFAQPGQKTKDYQECLKLWDEHVAPNFPSKPGT